jgi:hypothetical protein
MLTIRSKRISERMEYYEYWTDRFQSVDQIDKEIDDKEISTHPQG